jgi:hypothetical protein
VVKAKVRDRAVDSPRPKARVNRVVAERDALADTEAADTEAVPVVKARDRDRDRVKDRVNNKRAIL